MAEKPELTLGPTLRQDVFDRLSEKKSHVFWSGAAMAAVGILALLFPVFTTFSVALMVGWPSFLQEQQPPSAPFQWKERAAFSVNSFLAS